MILRRFPSANDLTRSSTRLDLSSKSLKKIKKSSSEHSLLSISLSKKKNKVKEYEIVKELGRGAYGIVNLAKRELDGKKVALKVIDKTFLTKNHKVQEAMIEKVILSMCRHPSIIQIYSTFQSKDKLFYVLEYLPNKDLDFVMANLGTLPNDLAVCFAAEIINCLDYLHNELQISHNDIKPSNIMLDSKYHLKLIDFSTAKVYKKKFDLQTKQFIPCENYIDKEVVGTAEYCSPEMVNQNIKDYRSNDIWAFGIILYYFYHGTTPFKTSNDYQTFLKIKDGKFTINQMIPDEVKDLISHLLEPNPKHRYTIEECKQHPYFKNIDWHLLLSQEVPIPKEIYKKSNSRNPSSGDNNNDFWNNICNELNGVAIQEYCVDIIGEYILIDNFFYGEAKEKESEENLVYEGIVTQIGFLKSKMVKLKLFADKMMEFWKIKKNKCKRKVMLSENVKICLYQDCFIKMQFNEKSFTLKTSKFEALKWYNLFNKIIYADQ